MNLMLEKTDQVHYFYRYAEVFDAADIAPQDCDGYVSDIFWPIGY